MLGLADTSHGLSTSLLYNIISHELYRLKTKPLANEFPLVLYRKYNSWFVSVKGATDRQHTAFMYCAGNRTAMYIKIITIEPYVPLR